MDIEQFAIYEKEPKHSKYVNGIVLGPFWTKEEAEDLRVKYGYGGDNYYVDRFTQPIKIKPPLGLTPKPYMRH